MIFDCFDADNFKVERLNRWREESQQDDNVKITCRMMNTDWDWEESTWITHWIWLIENIKSTRKYNDVSKLKAHKFNYLDQILSEIGFRKITRLKSKRLAIFAKKT